MLRVHFTSEDLARTVVAANADPLWEVVFSLHRLRERSGSRPHQKWLGWARERLHTLDYGKAVRSTLMPLMPKARYFPDFLTPPETQHGLAAGLDAVLAAPEERVRRELRKLDRTHGGMPSTLYEFGAWPERRTLTQLLASYHDAVIAPIADVVQARIDAERAIRARAVVDGGIHALLHSLRPTLRWNPPVLESDYAGEHDIKLSGRGLRLVPSYFCRGNPVSLADPELPPMVVYPMNHDVFGPPLRGGPSDTPLARLVGHTRAAILRAAAAGATTGELARLIEVSAATVSHHVAVLRDSGLITSRRSGNAVVHMVTPAGTGLLRATPPAP